MLVLSLLRDPVRQTLLRARIRLRADLVPSLPSHATSNPVSPLCGPCVVAVLRAAACRAAAGGAGEEPLDGTHARRFRRGVAARAAQPSLRVRHEPEARANGAECDARHQDARGPGEGA